MKKALFTLITIVMMVAGTFAAYAGNWQMQDNGKWCYMEKGTKLTGWYWIDGDGNGAAECYYMDEAGDMQANTTVDGYRVDAEGRWIENGYPKVRLVHPNACFNTNVDYSKLTIAQASNMSMPENASGNGIPYRGKVYTDDDYELMVSTARKNGKLPIVDQCISNGCKNPRMGKYGGYYCEYHTCTNPGCKDAVFDLYEVNCGFCNEHMKMMGLDYYGMKRAEQPKEVKQSSGSSKSSSKSSAYKSSAGSSKSYSNSGSSGVSSSSKKKTSSYYDSYDDGYDDVYFNEDYDEERYKTDWHYALGVDDAMDDEDWDW